MNLINKIVILLLICVLGLTVYLSESHQALYMPHLGVATDSIEFLILLFIVIFSFIMHVFAFFKKLYIDRETFILSSVFFAALYFCLRLIFEDFFSLNFLASALVPLYFVFIFALSLSQYIRCGKRSNPDFNKLKINKYIFWCVIAFNLAMCSWFVKTVAWTAGFQKVNKAVIERHLSEVKDTDTRMKEAGKRIDEANNKRKEKKQKNSLKNAITEEEAKQKLEEAKKKLEEALKRKDYRIEKEFNENINKSIN